MFRILHRILPVLILLLSFFIIWAGWFVRQIPGIFNEGIKQSIGKAVVYDDIRWVFPLTLRFEGIRVFDGNDDRSEILFQAERIDVTLKSKSISRRLIEIQELQMVSPKAIFRIKNSRKHHFFDEADLSKVTGSGYLSGRIPIDVIPDKVIVEDGTIKYEDYDVIGGYSTILSHVWIMGEYQTQGFQKPATYHIELQSLWAQVRDENPGKLEFTGDYLIEDNAIDGRLMVDNMHLKSLETYYRKYVDAKITDGIADINASFRGSLSSVETHAEMILYRLAFDQSEESNLLFGMNPESVRDALRNQEDLVELSVGFESSLLEGTDVFTDAFFEEFRKVLKSTFVIHMDQVVQEVIEGRSKDPSDMVNQWNGIFEPEQKGVVATVIEKLDQYSKGEEERQGQQAF